MKSVIPVMLYNLSPTIYNLLKNSMNYDLACQTMFALKMLMG